MLSGRIKIAADVSGTDRVHAGPIEIACGDDRVSSVVLSLSEDKVRLAVSFSRIDSEDTAEGIAVRIARQVIDRVVFRLGINASDPRVAESSLHPVNPSPNTIYPSSIVSQMVVSDQVMVIRNRTLDAPATDELKQYLDSPTAPGESKYGLYRTVIRATNPTEQFIQLYALLLAFVGSRQPEVNRFIRSIEPNVVERYSPHSNQNEPIYTWLRNELSHYPRTAGVTLASIRAQMASHLEPLRSLVKHAIEGLP